MLVVAVVVHTPIRVRIPAVLVVQVEVQVEVAKWRRRRSGPLRRGHSLRTWQLRFTPT